MKVMAGGLRSDKPLHQLKRQGALAAALKWAINNPAVDAAVASVTDMDQLEENVRAMSESFSDRERQLLSAALGEFGPKYCRLCGRCNGTCAQGLPIPEILRCGMYAEGYGQFAMGRSKYLELPAEVRGRTCGECSSCSVRCAYGIGVAERISRTRELLG